MGLLEAIAEVDILAGADPEDRDGDGISGQPNIVWSDEHGKPMLGRFGWKAGQPTVSQQAAAAFRGDVGISTPLYATFAVGAGGTQEAEAAEMAETVMLLGISVGIAEGVGLGIEWSQSEGYGADGTDDAITVLLAAEF